MVGLPHARGGVSALVAFWMPVVSSSPRPWGCFLEAAGVQCFDRVFPTPVGVFPPPNAPSTIAKSLPHARGGVSTYLAVTKGRQLSSPRPWGCFWSLDRRERRSSVFPTPVGVFLLPSTRSASPSGLPHARGGVSGRSRTFRDFMASSPRPWGCFRYYSRLSWLTSVFPTPVGVFLTEGHTHGL